MPQLLPHLVAGHPASFSDVFVGGGSVLIAVAEALPDATLVANDLDPKMAAFWRVVSTGHINKLLSRIADARPNVEEFRHLRDTEGQDTTDVDRAYRALYLNKCSFSGTGRYAIGGWNQQGKWKIDFAWNPDRITETLQACREMFRGRITVTEMEAWNAPWAERVYLDPPYFNVGDKFYGRRMTAGEHELLAHTLRQRYGWVLSYNDVPAVRDMYTWASVESLQQTYYSISGPQETRAVAKKRQLPELLIKETA